MVLLDSSVWIDHLRRGNSRAATLLETGDVACHPLIIGELACGGLKQRQGPRARNRMCE
jgi:predicted nucleic acid-binding protein